MRLRGNLPEWATDAVYNDVTLHIGFWDRIKILLGREVEVRVWTYCQNKPGRIEGFSDVNVWRLFPWTKKLGCAEATPKEGD